MKFLIAIFAVALSVFVSAQAGMGLAVGQVLKEIQQKADDKQKPA
ncbi:MAG: hypothetical protein ABL962_17830 [Fimbriimonadaceae bacterium]